MDAPNASAPPEIYVTVGTRLVQLSEAQLMVRRIARWFYWIAGLSMINWIAMVIQVSGVMIVGLGTTLLVQGAAAGIGKQEESMRILLLVISFVVTTALASVFVFLGYHAQKARMWPFVVGMVLYGLDSLVFLYARDWLALGFHVFVLIMLATGLRVTREMSEPPAKPPTLGSMLKE